ncbi:MAG: ABC transporter ATP-binding protein [Promethearchaeota archaeon]
MVDKLRIKFIERRNKFHTHGFKSNLRQILTYLWEYKTFFVIVLISGFMQSFMFFTIPLFLGPLLDILVDSSKSIHETIPIFILMFSIQGIVGILFGIRTYVNRWMGANVIYNLRNELYLTLQLMDFKWFDETKSGELLSRVTSDVNLLKRFLSTDFQVFIRQAFTFSLSFIILFVINVELAIYISFISPALFYMLLIFRKKLRPLFHSSRETYANLTHRIHENIQGITVVKSYSREDHEIKEFTKVNDLYFKKSMRIIKLQALFDPLIYLIDNTAFLIVILVGGFLVSDGKVGFGDLFTFILVMNFSLEPLYTITQFISNLPKISEICERVVYILNSKITVQEKANAIKMPLIKGEIQFKNVSFSFNPEKESFVLENINLYIKPGETIAILGSTGSGKSTLVKLIPRFYDATNGEILIDGINITNVTFKSLRKQIGYISQDNLLFSRTIKENIAFGKRDLPMEDIKRVAQVSDIDKFIESELQEQYDTKVAERGKTLSGGQIQRITIARALAIKPRILILDDATSSVDVDTEYSIQKHFKDVFKDSTTFLITQRISAVRNADRIIILDKGKIVQIGTHEELMSEQNGTYKKLYSTLKIEERN